MSTPPISGWYELKIRLGLGKQTIWTAVWATCPREAERAGSITTATGFQ